MGEDKYERETCLSALKLPILNMKPPSSSLTIFMESPDHYPSTHLASVPFKWEEQPGKPRPYSGRPESEPAKCCLELPPMLTPSPTAVLDGPYNVGRPKCSSFRFFRDGRDSFDSRSSGEDGSLLGGKKSGGGGRGLFGKKKKMTCKGTAGKKEQVDDAGGISGFSPFSVSSSESTISTVDDTYYWSNTNNTTGRRRKMRRNGSFSSVPHAKSSPLWATICEGLKQVIHWKSSRKFIE